MTKVTWLLVLEHPVKKPWLPRSQRPVHTCHRRWYIQALRKCLLPCLLIFAKENRRLIIWHTHHFKPIARHNTFALYPITTNLSMCHWAITIWCLLYHHHRSLINDGMAPTSPWVASSIRSWLLAPRIPGIIPWKFDSLTPYQSHCTLASPCWICLI